MRLKILRASLILLVSISVYASEDLQTELQNAQDALSAGKYDKAYSEYSRIAKQHDHPFAQFSLALFHNIGWGRPVNRVEACRWFEKAAKGKVVAAQHFFADCLVEGVHRKADSVEAITWYEKAADKGHVTSLCSIARLYINGTGVEKKPEKGLEYCRRAAKGGNRQAQLQIGRFFWEGDSSIHNPDKAKMWFEHAAQARSIDAAYYLGQVYENHLKDQNTALYWYEQAASQGFLPAYFATANLYFFIPPQTNSGKRSAKHLAKTYLWLSATKRASDNPEETAKAAQMLEQINKIMPQTWLADLDKKVDQHLAEYNK